VKIEDAIDIVERVKAHDPPAALPSHGERESRPILPFSRTWHDWGELNRASRDARECILDDSLLGGELGPDGQVLQLTAAAMIAVIVPASGLHAFGRWFGHAQKPATRHATPLPDGDFDELARRGPGHEDHQSIESTHAIAAGGDRLHAYHRHSTRA
jgi:hypothetical protein